MSFRKQHNTTTDKDRIISIDSSDDFFRAQTITVTTENWKVSFNHIDTGFNGQSELTLYSITAIGYTAKAYNGTRKFGFDRFQVKLTPSGRTFTSQNASNGKIQKADVLELLTKSETLLVIL